VQASRADRPRAVRSGRRLDARRLYRAAVGDERVFARRSPRPAPNTAVHLLVDLSGSMRDAVTRANGEQTSRGRLALEAALALALALSGVPGVAVAATAFPGLGGREDRVVRILPYGATVRARAGAFVQSPRGDTPLTAALWHAAAALLERAEERRVALVLTDGQPNDAASTRRLLARCRASGLEVIGVGIQVDVSPLFDVAVEVREVADLKRALFGVAERLLMAA
jgi:nitric oxide reductase activation protein